MTDIRVRMKPGSRYHDSEALTIEAGLAAVANAEGYLAPPEVVDAARPANAPLHPYFEWDDRIAARNHRIDQARHLIRAVEVHIVRDDGVAQWQPKYENVIVVRASEDEGTVTKERVYAPLPVVRTAPALIDQVANRLERDLIAAHQRYMQYAHVPEFRDRFAQLMAQVEALIGK